MNKKNGVAPFLKRCCPTRDFDITSIQLLLFILPFIMGGFFAWSSCVYTSALCVYLIWLRKKNLEIKLVVGDTFIAVCAFLVSMVVSCLWAVDRGEAAFGFAKFFLLFLFSIIVMQLSGKEITDALSILPYSGAAMTVVAGMLSLIPLFKSFFTVSGRLAGFFQYSNTYALFCLVGLIILSTGKTVTRKRIPCAFILLTGILASGSRTVFALTVVIAFVVVITTKNKWFRITVVALVAFVIAAGVIYAVVTGNFTTVGRFLTSSLSESTFVGRLLYYKDALPVILKHPFGLGYMGYYFLHKTFQTGVYSLMYVHNELLQCLLDIGWLPSVIWIVAIVESFIKVKDRTRRLVIGAIVLHSLFDFDLQFTSFFCILILCMDHSGKQKMNGKLIVIPIVCAVGLLCSIYFGIASFLDFSGKAEAALRVYPAYTSAELSIMTTSEDQTVIERLSREVCGRCDYIAPAWEAKAAVALADSDAEEYIRCSINRLKSTPYDIDAYEEVCQTLLDLKQIYQQRGDINSVNRCIEELNAVLDLLEETKAKTSALAYRINDKPDLDFSQELMNKISKSIS